MPSRRSVWALFLAASAACAIVDPSPARACAACACGDTSLTVVGAERPSAGRLRLLTELRASSEREVSDVLATRADDVRLVVAASYAPVNQLALSLELPLALRHYALEGLQSRTVFGLGDVEAGARLLLFADRTFAPRHTAGLRATLRMPTGPRLDDDVKHQPLAHDAQPGSGAWSPSVGAWYTFSERLFSVFTSLDVHRPGIGFDDLQLGPAVRAGATVQLQPRSGIAVRVGVDARVSGATTSTAGATTIDVPQTGGVLGMVSAGVLVSPIDDVVVHLIVAVPALSLQGTTREGPTAVLGVSFDALP